MMMVGWFKVVLSLLNDDVLQGQGGGGVVVGCNSTVVGRLECGCV